MREKAMEYVGIKQYCAFVDDRIASNGNADIIYIITQNILPLFHSHVQREHSKSYLALKRCCHLFSRLYIACQSRNQIWHIFMHKICLPYLLKEEFD